MTLHFDRVSVTNLGPYYGEQTLELTPSAASPLVLIHGENTLGKSKLFAAIRWCLYGAFVPGEEPSVTIQTLRALINRPAVREGAESLRVALEFSADGRPYRLTRSAKISGGVVRVTKDLRVEATVLPEAQVDEEIARLLHPQISEFFLFDAELMERFYERLNTVRERALIRNSIELVLGIPALQRAYDDVRVLAADASQRLEKSSKSKSEAAKIQRRLQELSSRHASLVRDREETSASLAAAHLSLDSKRALLKQVEGLQADIREQELLQARLSDLSKDELRLQAQMKETLSGGWISAAAIPIKAALERVEDRNLEAQRHEESITRARMRIAALEGRVQGGVCPTCAQTLPLPSDDSSRMLVEAKLELGELRERVGGEVVDLSLERRLRALLDQRSTVTYAEQQRALSAIQLTKYQIGQTLAAISDRLQGSDTVSIRTLAGDVRRLEEAIRLAEKALEKIGLDLKDVAAEQQKQARSLSRLPNSAPEVILESDFFAYTSDLLESTIGRYRESVRATVQASTSEMFLRLVRDPQGYEGVRIADDYKVELAYAAGATGETSEGGKQLLALSLIGSLKKAAVRGGPVVIDSPLGRLDLEHRANVLQRWIPALGSQAILLVQSGELTRADANRLIGGLVCHEYQIVRPDGNPEKAIIERTI